MEKVVVKAEKLRNLIEISEENFSEEITKLQEELNDEVNTIIDDYNLGNAGNSGKYDGYCWYTTPENIEKELNMYLKYTLRGLEDVIIEE